MTKFDSDITLFKAKESRKREQNETLQKKLIRLTIKMVDKIQSW